MTQNPQTRGHSHRIQTLSLAVLLGMTAISIAGEADPVTVTGLAEYEGPATAITAGGFHTCALLASGNVHCWGSNGEGQANVYNVLTPGYAGPATATTAGGYHTCALLATGNVHCWGDNWNGQATAYTGGDATAITTGWAHTCALLVTGNVHCWGYNGSGQATAYTGGDATAITTGWAHTCALLVSGNVHCWGDNWNGQATAYTGGDATAITAGYAHTCALLVDGNVHCWGDNYWGQADDYTSNPTGAQVSIPSQSVNHTVPPTPITTPPVILPPFCTIPACDTSPGSTPPVTTPPVTTPPLDPVPVGTPPVPVPQVCVLPVVVRLVCVGPFTIPPQHVTDTPPFESQHVPNQTVLPSQTIPAVCDAAPGTCVGPVTLLPNSTLLVTPHISMNATTPPTTALITHQPDGAVGPFYTNVTVPVLNFTIPVTFCPNTCPLPIEAHGTIGGSIWVTLTVDATSKTIEIPVPPVNF